MKWWIKLLCARLQWEPRGPAVLSLWRFAVVSQQQHAGLELSDRFGQLYSLSLLAKGPMNWFTQFIMTTAKIYIFHEWKILRTENCRKYDLLSIIAKHFLLGFAWSKQTKIAAVLTPCPHNATPLTKNTCKYWILFVVQVDRITWRKTKPVTTTIILIRPLYWAGMSHMRLWPCCQGLEWLIILPSSLTSPSCSPPTQYWSNTWNNCQHWQTVFSKPFETPERLKGRFKLCPSPDEKALNPVVFLWCKCCFQ